MCGRVRCTLNPNQIAVACALNPSSTPTLQIDRFRASYNIAPGNYLPVVRVRRSPVAGEAVVGPVIQCMKWGLIPSFTKKSEKPDHFRMLWSWTRLSIGRPTLLIDVQLDGQRPYGCKYNVHVSWNTGPDRAIRFYRNELDLLDATHVVWCPYMEDLLQTLSEICTVGAPVWCARTPIICSSIVHMHVPDRVLRQFGLAQHILVAVERIAEVQTQGRVGVDWGLTHVAHIQRWNERHAHIVQEVQPPTPLLDYERWYWMITRRWILRQCPPLATYVPRGSVERDLFNARSESIKEKASFRRLLPNNRCLVAVEGFYEWKKDGSKRQPYYIHFKDNQPLVFAALYDSWENSEGEILYTFTILTTRSSPALEWLHDRMPVILRDIGSISQWLNDSSAKHETIIGPCIDPNLVWYPVSPAMGKTSCDGPECIKEIKLAGEKALSMFFAKKSEVKCKSEPESLKSSNQEQALDRFEESAGDYEEKVTEERKDKKDPESCGVKREYGDPAGIEDWKGPEICGIKREFNETEAKYTDRAMKKEKSAKNSNDKQASLLSYFGKK